MLTIYGSDLSSPSNKVRFVANILGLPYEYKVVKLREGEHKTEAFLKINPVGKIPVADDDGFILFESGAIVKYLCSKHNSSLYPHDLQRRALIDQWIDFCSLHVGQAFYQVVFNRVFAPRFSLPVNDLALKDGLAQLERFFPIIEQQLAKTKFMAGANLSLADVTLLAVLDPSEIAQVDLSKFTRLNRWRQDLKKESFYTKCFKEYGEALKQPIAK